MSRGQAIRCALAAALLALGVPSATSATKTSDKAQSKPKEKAGEAHRQELRRQRNERILSREELERAIAPHVPAIQGCYKRHAADQKTAQGELRLEMLIRPQGTIQKLWVVAPGVRGKGLERCIAELSSTWRFPEKPGFTNAILPFSFVKTHAKGAGPLQSCWSAQGCPERTRRNRK